MEVVYVTSMKKMPKNCGECKICICNLPMNKRKIDTVNKLYMRKRHPECPLREE